MYTKKEEDEIYKDLTGEETTAEKEAKTNAEKAAGKALEEKEKAFREVLEETDEECLTDIEEKAVDDAVKSITEPSDWVFDYELVKPLRYDGEEYTKLSFDFDKLHGSDIINIETELYETKGIVVVDEFNNPSYITGLAAKACLQPVMADVFGKMNVIDCNRLLTRIKTLLQAITINSENKGNGVFERKLVKPLMIEGKSVDTLTFDFGSLSGEQCLEIENYLNSHGKKNLLNNAFNSDYLIALAERACDKKIGEKEFSEMSFADYSAIKSKAKIYMLGFMM